MHISSRCNGCRDSEMLLDATVSKRMTEKGQKGQTLFQGKNSLDSSLRHGDEVLSRTIL